MLSLLKGIRVLDMSWLLPGPYLTVLLGDLGADVIKVEETNHPDYLRGPGGEDNRSLSFQWVNRNKRDIAVDMRQEAGRELVRAMAGQVDVLVEGFRPGAAERRGFGYETIREVNPGIVYCSITAFGQSGPFARLATHGGAYDAVAGLAVPYELPDGTFAQYRPFPHGWTNGSWLGAMAVCAALVQAKTGGGGAYIDISCADATLMALGQEALPALNSDAEWPPPPDEAVNIKYCYYRTKDDRFMLIQALEKQFWDGFCDAVDRPDLKDRGDWSRSTMDIRLANEDPELREELVKLFAGRTQEEWVDVFLANDVAGAPYYSFREAIESPLFQSRGMFSTQERTSSASEMTVVSNGIKVGHETFEIARRAPNIGEHSKEILASFGYTDSEVAELNSKGVVVQADGH